MPLAISHAGLLLKLRILRAPSCSFCARPTTHTIAGLSYPLAAVDWRAVAYAVVAAAVSVLAQMPELGTLNRGQAAALAGLAPWTRQSGPWEGQRHIGGGRAGVRRALYMSAVAAVRCNRPLKAFYRRLRDAGKKPKVALTAVMRKLIVLMNHALKDPNFCVAQ